jgi:hypothetical protein
MGRLRTCTIGECFHAQFNVERNFDAAFDALNTAFGINSRAAGRKRLASKKGEFFNPRVFWATYWSIEMRKRPPGRQERARFGFIYLHQVECGQMPLFKIGMSFNPARREKQWQRTCPKHKHKLITMIKVRYQRRTGNISIPYCGSFLIVLVRILVPPMAGAQTPMGEV